MKAFLCSLAAVAMCAALPSQITCVVPQGFASQESPDWGNAFPFGWFPAGIGSSIRTQFIYDADTFTGQGVPSPVMITKLRFRADNNQSASWAGGTWSYCIVKLASCPNDHTSPSNTFAFNLGADAVNCINGGPITVLPGTVPGAGGPGPWVIDLPLTTPFLYDPVIGQDLTVDINIVGGSWVGGGGANSAGSTYFDTAGNTGISRVFNASFGQGFMNLPTGSSDQGGLVTEFTYTALQGYASANLMGQGCYDHAASFYEQFPANTFDLGSVTTQPNGLQMVPNPTGGWYVLPGATGWYTPTSPNLGLGDETIYNLTLPFAVQTPTGPKNYITISPNGFVWMNTNSAHGCCDGDAQQLLAGAERLCVMWQDLNPAAGGTVHYDFDPVTQSVYITWMAVPEYGHASAQNTCQIAFLANGSVTELRWLQCASFGHNTLVGWSAGGGARNPGNRDLSQPQPFTTETDSLPLRLRMSPRPILGTAVTYGTTNIPLTAPFALTLLDFQAFPLGIGLDPYGAPGCYAYTGYTPQALSFFALVFNGTAVVNLTIPPAPVFSGLNFFAQTMAFTPGVNPLGIMTSNALNMVIQPQ